MKKVLLACSCVLMTVTAFAADKAVITPENCRGTACMKEGIEHLAKKEIDLARDYFELGCRREKEPGSCAALASLYHDGNGVQRSYSVALEMYMYSCSKGAAAGCMGAASMYEKGAGKDVRKNISEAIHYSQRACELGNMKGCYNAGLLYANGMENPDPVTALPFFQKACDNGYGDGCGVIAIFYRDGTVVEQDEKKGRDYLARGCNATTPSQLSCDLLAAAKKEDELAKKSAKK